MEAKTFKDYLLNHVRVHDNSPDLSWEDISDLTLKKINFKMVSELAEDYARERAAEFGSLISSGTNARGEYFKTKYDQLYPQK